MLQLLLAWMESKQGICCFIIFALQNFLLQTILGCVGEQALWNNINFCKNWWKFVNTLYYSSLYHLGVSWASEINVI